MEGTENIEDSLHLLSSAEGGGHFSASPAQPLKPGTDDVGCEKVCKNYADKFSHVFVGQRAFRN